MRGPILIAALGIGLAGCGGVNFTGTYKGPITAVLDSCSNGATASPSTQTVSIALRQPTATEVDVDAVKCPALQGTANGNVVTLKRTTCPPETDSSGTVTVTFTGGTLTLDGSSLALAADASNLIAPPSGPSFTCKVHETGTLTLQ